MYPICTILSADEYRQFWTTLKVTVPATPSCTDFAMASLSTCGQWWGKASDFSRFTEVGPARQGVLKSISQGLLSYNRPTVDPVTGATDYQGQEEFDRGENLGDIFQLMELLSGEIGPPGQSGLELVPAGGGVPSAGIRAKVLAPPALFAESQKNENEKESETNLRLTDRLARYRSYRASGGKLTLAQWVRRTDWQKWGANPTTNIPSWNRDAIANEFKGDVGEERTLIETEGRGDIAIGKDTLLEVHPSDGSDTYRFEADHLSVTEDGRLVSDELKMEHLTAYAGPT